MRGASWTKTCNSIFPNAFNSLLSLILITLFVCFLLPTIAASQTGSSPTSLLDDEIAKADRYLEREQNLLDLQSIVGQNSTQIEKFVAIANYYRFPFNILIAASASEPGDGNDRLIYAMKMANSLSVQYLSGEDMGLILTDWFHSRPIAEDVLKNSYVIVDRLFPKKP